MAPAQKFQSHEAYFASLPSDVRQVVLAIHSAIQAAVPASKPCISYNMPAFRLGKTFIYFAAFKKHIGVYPPVVGSEQLRERLAPFRGPKGNLIFPLDQPVPVNLIAQVATTLAQEYGYVEP
jgi:uncharacterized protein YdhG (YjbR/CyaY superfamily)